MRTSVAGLVCLFGAWVVTPAFGQDVMSETEETGETATEQVVDSAAPEEATTPDESTEEERSRKSQYNRNLSTVEQEVDQLKERVFRSKATLQLLRELIVEGASMGARIVLWHQNKLGSSYRLESVQYYLDGKNVYAKADPNGGLDGKEEFQIVDHASSPGSHNLQVNAVLRGNGYGVFSYLKGYAFKVQSSLVFQVEDGHATILKVTMDERSGFWRSFTERPGVAYEERTEELRVD